MSLRPEKRYEGKSDKSFADAAQKAFDAYKKEILGDSPAERPIRFRVADMYVTASNPIHDFIIELEQVEP